MEDPMTPSTRLRFVMIAAATALVLSTFPAAARAQAPAGQRSLYDRLGGIYPIAVVVDAFIDRLLVNDVLNANPAIAAARARVPAPGLKVQVSTMVCQATGGPCTYTGRTMKQSHAHLNISDREWQEMLREFQVVLTRFKVPAAEQRELVAIVESTKGDIVAAR
jgi:hemoglobin